MSNIFLLYAYFTARKWDISDENTPTKLPSVKINLHYEKNICR